MANFVWRLDHLLVVQHGGVEYQIRKAGETVTVLGAFAGTVALERVYSLFEARLLAEQQGHYDPIVAAGYDSVHHLARIFADYWGENYGNLGLAESVTEIVAEIVQQVNYGKTIY